MNDGVNVADRQVPRRQTILDCANRKSTGLFLTAESLLGCRRHDISVAHQRCRSVQSLPDAHFGTVRVCRAGFFEAFGTGESTDPKNSHAAWISIPFAVRTPYHTRGT